jgi:uncharacterized protein
MGEKNRMKTIIYFKEMNKLTQALHYFNYNEFANKETLVKLHMGEKNNKYHLRAEFVKFIITHLVQNSSSPYLYDTTVCYNGLRNTIKGYEKCAALHGFSSETIGCPIVIDDKGISVCIDNRNYEVAHHLYHATHIFAITHVKGHIATGMGGAIKNFGMGGVTKETKKRMHEASRPIYHKNNCTFCGKCAFVCPFNALEVKEGYWNLNKNKCFGCGVCVDACNTKTIQYTDADFNYLLACAAKTCVQDKKVLYLNELKRIAKNCDCDPNAGPIICPDIGYLLADDPVAIDKASLDLINEEKPNVFEKQHHIDAYKQIDYGEKIGLGSTSYRLITL